MDRKLGKLAFLLAACAATSVPTLAQTTAPPDKIAAMLNEPAAAPTALEAVVLSSKNGDVRLQQIPGTFSTTYAFVTVLMFVDFPDLRANARTNDRRPALHLKIGGDPKNRIYLVKVTSNPKTSNRSVKIGHSGFGSVGGMTAPDAKWIVACTATEDGPGMWKIVPDSDLAPGEYGVFSPKVAGGMQIPGSGDLYDFGVDPS